MNISYLIFSHVVIPLISGVIFLCYTIYLITSGKALKSSHRFFALFISTFCIYLIGRPVQVLAGGGHLPLIVNNIRLMFLCSLTMPSLLIMTDFISSAENVRRKLLIFGIGALLGISYSIVNTFGTDGSFVVFTIGDRIPYYNMVYPEDSEWHAKDVISYIQASVGFILLTGSFCMNSKKNILQTKVVLWKRHDFFIRLGVAVFGISFLAGSLIKDWALSYVCSISSAVIIGFAIMSDIRKVNNRMRMFVPFIKEEIIKNITFSSMPEDAVLNMLSAMDISHNLDTFIVFEVSHNEESSLYSLHKIMQGHLKNELDIVFGESGYIMFALSGHIIGIALNARTSYSSEQQLPVLEKIRAKISLSTGFSITVAAGRTFERVSQLNLSYYQALRALEYARHHGENCVVHIDNIDEGEYPEEKFPLKEKNLILSHVRLGDSESAKEEFGLFIKKFEVYSAGKPELMRIRLYELMSAVLDAAMTGGGDTGQLHMGDAEYFAKIAHVREVSEIREWFESAVCRIALIVRQSHSTKNTIIVLKAKKYIDGRFAEEISVDDAALAAGVSRSYFLKLFKENTGITFTDYLTELRILKSKEMLVKTAKSITEIAYDVGFNDANYFTRVFSEQVGASPTKYRKKIAEG